MILVHNILVESCHSRIQTLEIRPGSSYLCLTVQMCFVVVQVDQQVDMETV